MRKGFVFTLDALLALVLVTVMVAGIIGTTENVSGIYKTQIRGENKQMAEDLLETFRTVPLDNLVSPTQIERWMTGTDPVLNLTYVSPQMSPLQIVATYWALNSTEYRQKAETIMRYILGNLAEGYKYQLIINNYTSPYLTFDNSYKNASDVGSATIFVSGYVSNETPRGYVAKAYLTKLVATQEKLVGIQRVLAGGYYGLSWYNNENSLEVDFDVNLPTDANVTNGIWHAAQRGSQETMDVYINGYHLRDPYSSNVTDILNGGSNIIKAFFTSSGDDEIGFGSGSWISLKYKTSTPQVDNPGLVKLYKITSDGTGIYYLNSLFVPGNVTGINIKLTIEGVHEVRVYYSNGTALNLIYENTSVSPGLTTVTIDNATLVSNLTKYTTLKELSKKNFNLVIMLDAYYDPNSDDGRSVRYAGQDYNYNWDNRRILYGFPDSYISITYVPRVTTTRFTIPIEQVYPLNGENPVYWRGFRGWYLAGYRTMYFDYYLPDKAIPWYVDVWTAIHFLDYPSGTLTLYEGPNANTEVFSIPIDYYLIRVAYTRLKNTIMVPGDTNEFKLESSSNSYVFRVNDSRAIVHYFLRGYASYGNTFTYYAQDNACGYNLTYYYNLSGTIGSGTVLVGNCPPSESPKQINASELQPWKYALDDAIYRLFLQLGANEYTEDQIKSNRNLIPGAEDNPIRIQLKGLAAKAIGIKNVPNTGRGIQVTLRIWRGR